jgi:hypothetical protein
MKTILGTEIPENIRGIVYLCHFDYMPDPPVLTVVREILCEDAFQALTLYAEIPNPPSQLAYGKTYKDLCWELSNLYNNMKDPKWLKELSESI